MSSSKTTSKKTKGAKSVAKAAPTPIAPAAKPNGVGMKVVAAANRGNPPPENI